MLGRLIVILAALECTALRIAPPAPKLARPGVSVAQRVAPRSGAPIAQADEPTETAGKGFGSTSSRYEAEEARGREALEKLRAASAAKGYDATLQGLQEVAAEEEAAPTPEQLEEFKSNLTLGFAGFLFLGGFVSLFLGGSLWEPSPADSETSPTEASSAFGFVPKTATRAEPAEAAPPVAGGPTW